jgi:hypothetical protein
MIKYKLGISDNFHTEQQDQVPPLADWEPHSRRDQPALGLRGLLWSISVNASTKTNARRHASSI